MPFCGNDKSETKYQTWDAGSNRLSYQTGQSFNADGQLQSHQYPDGSAQRYSYQNGQLAAITLPNQSQIHYGSYRWMQPQQIRTPGATKTLSYDALQRPALIEIRSGQNPNKLLAQRRYAYDEAGNIVQIQSELGQTGYGYDPLNRLSKAEPDQALQTLGLPQEAYSYDAAGNRLSSAHQAGAWTYNADNQMTQYPATTPFERNPGVETQVSYTAQGHTQKESNVLESKEYEYNAAERLIRYVQKDETLAGQSAAQTEASYRYDPFGRRIAKTVKQGGQTKTTYYIYSEQGLMAEADETGKLTKAYGFNPTTMQLGLWSTDPIWQAETSNGSLTDPKARYDWLHTDHLGTPILATTEEGQTSWRAVSESFGATLPIDQDIEMNLRFPGQYFDAETGTHYNFHRDYRPNAGRYLQGDPIKLRGGINLFNYANGNPLVKLDSMGLKTCGSGWNEIIVPDNPAYFQFSPCCEEHDNCYGDCYGPSKSVCDLNFFNCMQKTCNALVDNIYVWYICSEIANSYYSAVNKWGDESFYAARNKCNDCFPRPSEILPRFRSWSY